ncbi:MAG: sugar transferase [Acidimicrobiia bacterium]|nr:sugar transferase [Acidimicrobiia bacterium]
MTAPAIRTALWSGHDWIDQFRPGEAWLTGNAYLTAKRIFDLVVVVAAAPLWLMAMALIALIIKIDDPSAPVVFVHTRAGRGGTSFKMRKFRTMVPNAEEMKQQLWHLNELEWPDFKITNDPRVTRPGRLLRKTSLDELPQLLNVVMGQMSLVGPRPTGATADQYDLWQTERLDVTPGVTGLWQLYGRATTLFDDRTRLDITYVQRRCLLMDVQILLRTVPAVLKAKGAH